MVIETVGVSMIGYSLAAGVYRKVTDGVSKAKSNMRKAFIDAELYKPIKTKNKTYKNYPKVIEGRQKENTITVVFSIPKGMNPDDFTDKLYVFKQYFGKYISLKMTDKNGIMQISTIGLPSKLPYDYDQYKLEGKLPILCGVGIDGKTKTFDMIVNPHILIAGETGSGKSSGIRSIITTLIQHKSPKDLRLVMGDLKRSEFHLFKKAKHTDSVSHSADELRPELKKVKKELVKRGNKLDENEVSSIEDLDEQLPYIVVCIDEVVLLKKDADIMDTLEEISSVGRSLGVYIILSLQRPDSQVLDGKLKVNLTVRMGYLTADSINSKVIGTPGSEKLETAGRMILKVNADLQEIQSPWLDTFTARRILEPYKEDKNVEETKEKDKYSEVLELFDDDET